jgi:hypothetical protein
MEVEDRLPRVELRREGRMEVPERFDAVRKRVAGTAMYACAEWGRAGGAVGWFIA